MKDFRSLAHVRRECKYHVVFIPKYRRKLIYGKLRALVAQVTLLRVEIVHRIRTYVHFLMKVSTTLARTRRSSEADAAG